jgi:hypothetical protein
MSRSVERRLALMRTQPHVTFASDPYAELTKREYMATHILAGKIDITVAEAVALTDMLIAQLNAAVQQGVTQNDVTEQSDG